MGMRSLAVIAGLIGVTACQSGAAAPPPSFTGTPTTLASLANDATRTALSGFYAGGANVRVCAAHCGSGNTDWGTDSILYVLYEQWLLTHDASITAVFPGIVSGLPPPTTGVSDEPLWDAVAAIRAFDVTGSNSALQQALADYHAVTTSSAFAKGACAPLDYQFPNAGGNQLKTLETDANRVLAGVLLSQRVTDRTEGAKDLADAQMMYAAIRRVFLDPVLPLYTVYVFDNGATCTQLPRRFFASVNGIMIQAGVELAKATGNQQYAADARATADGVISSLSDSAGIFVNEQAENDIVEPLVLGMLAMYQNGDAAAGTWIVENAIVAAHTRAADGTYSRFFDGPPPQAGTTVSVWQTNGALGLIIAAGSISPNQSPGTSSPWSNAVLTPVNIHGAPATFTFTGSGIALLGTLPDQCVKVYAFACEGGHVHLRIDGTDLTDETGIWQGKALLPFATPNTILFAWRWPSSGTHTLQFDPVVTNGKEGGTAIDVTSALVIPP